MPAIMDDPDTRTIYRVSGALPYPDPAHPSLPPSIVPRHVTLRDRQTVATVVPFASRHQVPESLLRYLNDQFNKEIEGGDTYPMMDPMPFDKFAGYWFQNFGGIMLLGNIESAEDVVEGKDWSKECLGTFYIKPNYPGRSSHVCNAGFIVTDASRNRGVGRLMGEAYLEWAPKLGYTYSVFNLVYETNVASCKIWDALGFKRIGRVKGCGNLKSYPDRLVDAIMFGRELGGDAAGNGGSEDLLVSEERFDKIKFYLKYGRYPNGADRAEKSRLRSAATHYKLLDGDVLMLKDKEVISDPQRQYDIARRVHNQAHAGINKTTAIIAERYHWSRIKETVSDIIRGCSECKELGKQPLPSGSSSSTSAAVSAPSVATNATSVGMKRAANLSSASGAASSKRSPSTFALVPPPPQPLTANPSDISSLISPHISHAQVAPVNSSIAEHPPSSILQGPLHSLVDHQPPPPHYQHHNVTTDSYRHNLHIAATATATAVAGATLPPLANPHDVSLYQPIDPQIISQPGPPLPPSSSAHTYPHHMIHQHHNQHHHHHQEQPYSPFAPASPAHHNHDPDTDTFQALLNAADEDDDHVDNHGHSDVEVDHISTNTHPSHRISETHTTNHDSQDPEQPTEEEKAAMDRDLDMLIEPPDDEDDTHNHNHDGLRSGSRSGSSSRIGAMDVDGVDGDMDHDIEMASSAAGATKCAKMDVHHLLSSSSHDHGSA
ncbi:protein SPT10 [Diplogelasinospora grovesii]|uniref:Protein SPT10 n=1 Tax=Diplogelasinospora grovesii TaxID=303347 RepID=A0AAN6MX53_9PEZI|nr:protein SPT10 [Diplogelasinospora grovesii]